MSKSPKKPAGGRIALLAELAPHTDDLLKNGIREQVAALCFRVLDDSRDIEVLLVTSRVSNRWIIPKGWPIKGKKPHEVAAIEAFEEAGIQGKAHKKAFGYYTYMKVLDDGRRVPCCVQVHLVEAEKISRSFKEKGQRASEWVSCAEAARRIGEPELKGLIFALQRKRSAVSLSSALD